MDDLIKMVFSNAFPVCRVLSTDRELLLFFSYHHDCIHCVRRCRSASIHRSICLSICRSICRSICISIHRCILSLCISLHRCADWSVYQLQINLLINANQSVCISIRTVDRSSIDLHINTEIDPSILRSICVLCIDRRYIDLCVSICIVLFVVHAGSTAQLQRAWIKHAIILGGLSICMPGWSAKAPDGYTTWMSSSFL